MADPPVDVTTAPTVHVTAAPTVHVTAAPIVDLTAAPTVHVTAAPIVDLTAAPIVDVTAAPRTRHRLVPTGKLLWRRAFAGLAEEAPKARAFVRCLLAGTRWVDEAEFTVAELVSNSLFHSRSGEPGGYFVVELTRRPRSVRLGVYDLGGGGTPARAGHRMEDPENALLHEHGRGLDAVTSLAARVGWRGDPATGHLVWALFADPTPERRPS
ncbi:ATP-binding protein [Sphaerisporangium sp. TRM90804]|uniref:ATP-binding protein n=1 Tax=Sphaerisporangium sp. TRM90804 TaxID=3031113 RepID=UPI002446BE2D|nr:ATP-binding protein [Sphaerisporangium sp. TRM90804]MDH2423874.1 ATP-binding protein [Sphaerisporangium sp. TRM90804]